MTFVVIAATAVPDNLRGVLTRWLIEPMAGVYAGTLSARVRDHLWAHVADVIHETDGYATCIYPAPNEQGYTIRTAGRNPRRVIDLDGLELIAWPRATAGRVADHEAPSPVTGW